MKALVTRSRSRSSANRGIAFFCCMRYTLDEPQSVWPRSGRSGWTYSEALIGFLITVVGASAYAGTVTPGNPRVESDRYEVPILLGGTGNEVAALNFSLAYDPAVFQPVSITPGAAAQAAGKLVTANLAEPGNYIVVMMGFNQTPVSNGEVARVVFERVGTATTGDTTLAVNAPTLSTAEGAEISAEGGSAAVRVGVSESKPEGEEDTTPETGNPAPPSTNAGSKTRPQPTAGPVDKDARADAPTAAGQARGESSPSGTPVAGRTPDAAHNVAAAAARAIAERERLNGPDNMETPGLNKSASSVTKEKDGRSGRSEEIESNRSLTIEASSPVNKNTAGAPRSEGAPRETARDSGGMWPLLAGLTVLALAVGAWFLRTRKFRG